MLAPTTGAARLRGAVALAIATGLAAATLSACGAPPEPESSSGSGDSTASASASASKNITDYCGKKDLKLAYVDGFGGNGWRKTVRKQLELEAAKCSNISKVSYFDANGDPQKYASLINSAVAQGFGAIVTFNDFGSSALTALRSAYKAGVAVVPFTADPGGQAGVDYTAFIKPDQQFVGETWSAWMNKALKGKGGIVMLGGTPGNTSSLGWITAYKAAASAYPGVTLLEKDPVTTNWDVAGTQKATAGVLSSHSNVNGLLTDYFGTVSALVRSYEAAGLPLVPMAGMSSSNELGCLYQQVKAKNPDFQLLSLDGSTNAVLPALRKAVAAAEGIPNNEPTTFRLEVFIDTLDGKMPRCEPTLPPDADLSADLSLDQLKEVFN
ncbi:substrate-binding domain-containing protein [Dactylosporangium sp. CA-233914]|uniref:substrate-binding domain-containing protein n=1 Tax=Dactylosporangium sp. CA-233914 TaxID=3239934 RepID=UPI003D8CD285